MKQCPCDGQSLQTAYTRQGVEIDICPSCRGIWLDRDEIYLFTREPGDLKRRIEDSFQHKKPSGRLSPVSGQPMVELSLWGGKVTVDYCEQSGGIWLDEGELQQFPVDQALIEIDPGVGDIEQPVSRGDVPRGKKLEALPNLSLTSASVLFGMYALLVLMLIILVEAGIITPLAALAAGLCVAALQFLAGPWIMDVTLRWLYRIRWVGRSDLPEHLQQSVDQICRSRKIRFPRFGIIEDGSPQAFTYGHHPNNGRIVLSRGLIDLLQPQETEAVVAHEIGHMVHWDMLVMTIVQVVPLVLYSVYRMLIRMRSSGRDDKSAGARLMIAVTAYVFYIISQYCVLWFSRIREYYADRFSGEATGHPEHLASALVKIGYGMAGRSPEIGTEKGSRERSHMMKGIQPLGIFNDRQAVSLAVSAASHAASMGGDIDKEALKDAAKWDLWNPWAVYYELHSTHPLIAKRLKMLSSQAQVMGLPAYINFDERKPESYWNDFFLDVVVSALPGITLLFGAVFLGARAFSSARFSGTDAGVFMIFLGLSFLIRTLYVYSSTDFIPMSIRNLLKKIKVSAINPVACRVRGKIIGRGVPGLIFSEDFVLQDETGIIFLDYQQPLAIWNLFFGLFRAASFHNQEAEVVGWYRRAPVPFIEVRYLIVNGETTTCFVYNVKMISAFMILGLGVLLLLI